MFQTNSNCMRDLSIKIYANISRHVFTCIMHLGLFIALAVFSLIEKHIARGQFSGVAQMRSSSSVS